MKQTIFKLAGEENFDPAFVEEARAVRLNNSSCQVYIALKPGEEIENVGDLLFHSEHDGFNIDAMLSRDISSRTFSFYYPQTRPHADPRYFIVSSTNANYKDWAELSEEEYLAAKQEMMIQRSIAWSSMFLVFMQKLTILKPQHLKLLNITRCICMVPRSVLNLKA